MTKHFYKFLIPPVHGSEGSSGLLNSPWLCVSVHLPPSRSAGEIPVATSSTTEATFDQSQRHIFIMFTDLSKLTQLRADQLQPELSGGGEALPVRTEH